MNKRDENTDNIKHKVEDIYKNEQENNKSNKQYTDGNTFVKNVQKGNKNRKTKSVQKLMGGKLKANALKKERNNLKKGIKSQKKLVNELRKKDYRSHGGFREELIVEEKKLKKLKKARRKAGRKLNNQRVRNLLRKYAITFLLGSPIALMIGLIILFIIITSASALVLLPVLNLQNGAGLEALNNIGRLGHDKEQLAKEIKQLKSKSEGEKGLGSSGNLDPDSELARYILPKERIGNLENRLGDIRIDDNTVIRDGKVVGGEANKSENKSETKTGESSKSSSNKQVESGGSPFKSDFQVNQGFGKTDFVKAHPSWYPNGIHDGHDLYPLGNSDGSLYAIVKGKATTRQDTCGGNVVEIVMDNGESLYYGHLDGYAIKEGDKVGIGDKIGKMGSTGSCSSGDHVHISLNKKGTKGWEPKSAAGFIWGDEKKNPQAGEQFKADDLKGIRKGGKGSGGSGGSAKINPDENNDKNIGESSVEGYNEVDKLYRFFEDKGYSTESIRGIASVVESQSSFESKYEDFENGKKGIMLWDKNEFSELEKYAQKKGYHWFDYGTQLSFLERKLSKDIPELKDEQSSYKSMELIYKKHLKTKDKPDKEDVVNMGLSKINIHEQNKSSR